jgi:hypothetical protein
MTTHRHPPPLALILGALAGPALLVSACEFEHKGEVFSFSLDTGDGGLIDPSNPGGLSRDVDTDDDRFTDCNDECPYIAET